MSRLETQASFGAPPGLGVNGIKERATWKRLAHTAFTCLSAPVCHRPRNPRARTNMSLTSILSADAIDNAIKDCQAPDSFCYKKFFKLCGLSSKTPQEIKNVFQILDDDKSGYIEESELKFFLQKFVPGARTLSDAEAKSFISAADDDNDGRIGAEEFQAMVLS